MESFFFFFFFESSEYGLNGFTDWTEHEEAALATIAIARNDINKRCKHFNIMLDSQ
jgi:hypothetical protein